MRNKSDFQRRHHGSIPEQETIITSPCRSREISVDKLYASLKTIILKTMIALDQL